MNKKLFSLCMLALIVISMVLCSPLSATILKNIGNDTTLGQYIDFNNKKINMKAGETITIDKETNINFYGRDAGGNPILMTTWKASGKSDPIGGTISFAYHSEPYGKDTLYVCNGIMEGRY